MRSLVSVFLMLFVLGACTPKDAKVSNFGDFQSQSYQGNFPKVTGAADNKSFDISQTILAGQHQILQMSQLLEYALNPEKTSLLLNCKYKDSLTTKVLSDWNKKKSWIVSYRNCDYGDKKSSYDVKKLFGHLIFKVSYNDQSEVESVEVQSLKNRYGVSVRDKEKTKNKGKKKQVRQWAELYNDVTFVAKRVNGVDDLEFEVSYQSQMEFVQRAKSYIEREGNLHINVFGRVVVDNESHDVTQFGDQSSGLGVRFFREGNRELYSLSYKSRKTKKIFYEVAGELSYAPSLLVTKKNGCLSLEGNGEFAVNVGRNFLKGSFISQEQKLQVKNGVNKKWFKGKKEQVTSLPTVCSLGRGFYPGYFLFD